MESSEKNTPQPTGGEQKINEYISRIKAGESQEEITQGLPLSFKDAIEKGLSNQEAITEDAESQKEVSSPELAVIPPQYEGMDSETLDFIWTVPEYVDPEKTKTELERKAKALEHLGEQENAELAIKTRKNEESKQIEKLRQELGATTVNEGKEVIDPFKHKEVEHSFGDNEQAVGMYNTLMDMGKGAMEGFKEDAIRKIEQYTNEIKAGKDKEYVLSGAPEAWRKEVERRLAGEEGTKKEKQLSPLEGMSQVEFAAYLVNQKTQFSLDKIYDLLTVRPELRNELLNSSAEAWSKNFSPSKEYKEQVQRIENNKELRGDSNPAWTSMEINNTENKEKDGRHKGYVTMTSQDALLFAENLENNMKELHKALQAAGYNGSLKVPASLSGLKLRFDNIVIHGATEKDVDLALPIIQEFLASKNLHIEGTKKGIDQKNEEGKKKSHTELLAEKVFQQING
ncbi:MAG TPA: hypothetical protein PK950_01830 [Candidatus Paceibacterota bacterium]|nr:hypothetical protein [Candidatus Paceibacterota bacterium]